MRNYSAICEEMVVEMVGFEEVEGDVADATASGIIVAHVKSLYQKLLNQVLSS